MHAPQPEHLAGSTEIGFNGEYPSSVSHTSAPFLQNTRQIGVPPQPVQFSEMAATNLLRVRSDFGTDLVM
jgi:hypothetical protein